MTELKKTPPGTTGRTKLDIIRNVQMPPASPVTHSAASKAVEKTAPAPAKTETAAPVSTANRPTERTASARRDIEGRAVYVAHQFSFAFNEESHHLAAELAAKIGCKLEDIITLVSRRFDATALDVGISTVKPRVGPMKRINLKVRQDTITELRRLRDPLNVRSDGYLLRAPVVAALDAAATDVLKELKEQYDA